jgi:hypothetical protein
MEPRRSSRIQEIAARQKVKEVERAAKLEAESRAPEKPIRPKATLKRKRPDQKLPSTVSDPVAEADAGSQGKGDLSAGPQSPKKKQKTTPQQDESGTEYQDVSADKGEREATPFVQEQHPVKQVLVNEDQRTEPHQEEASVEVQDMSADNGQETTPFGEEQAVVDDEQNITTYQDEVTAEVQGTSANEEGTVITPLIEEQAAAEQAVANEDKKTTPQQDEANAVPQDISLSREDRVATSLAKEQDLADKNPKTTPHQEEARAEVANISTDNEEQATTSLVEEQASAEEGQQFLKVLSSIILANGALRRKVAARRKCLDEQDDVDWLLSFKRSSLANVPPEESFPGVREKTLADIQKLERQLEERNEQEANLDKAIRLMRHTLEIRKRRIGDLMNAEMPPDILPPSLKNNADFRESYKYCRSLAQTVKGIELKIEKAERERETALDRYFGHAEQALFPNGARTDSQLDSEEVDSHYQDLRDSREWDSRLVMLEHDVSQTKAMWSAQKDVLVSLAEQDLVKQGKIPAEVQGSKNPEPEPVQVEQEKVSEQASAEPSGFEILKASRDAAKAELMAAQAHLCTAYKEFQGRRNLTEGEIAQLPKTITEDDIGLELQMKLMRTTRKYIEAQERVRTAQAEGRRLDVPGVDKYPVDQTWDFEDRPDDGYAESAIADRMEKSRPRVRAWLSQVAMSGKPLSPSTKSPVPKKVPGKLHELAELRLGDDKAEDFSSDGAKERIARYQQACEDLRDSGLFPLAVPDRLILKERLSELDSHMI